jgi:hypothetical protein
MKSHPILLCLTIFALLGAAPAAIARTVHTGPVDHSGVAAGHRHVAAFAAQGVAFGQSAHSAYDAQCRAHNRIQSWGYETCLQQLHASAVTGGGGY